MNVPIIIVHCLNLESCLEVENQIASTYALYFYESLVYFTMKKVHMYLFGFTIGKTKCYIDDLPNGTK